jgi:hypothetical protein
MNIIDFSRGRGFLSLALLIVFSSYCLVFLSFVIWLVVDVK